jgi:hypothetical protein
MDVEGSEGQSLLGARKTIQQFKPKLAISIYHSLADLIDLPRLVRDIEPRYELYIEHHTVHAEETVLYARVP